MRLQTFILTEGRAKGIGEDEAIDLIKKNCMKHVKGVMNKSRAVIYRGTYTNMYTGFGYLDPRQGAPRESANTYNYMTLLMDNLPAWKQYPKRSRSVVCSTYDGTSENFGDVYYVYPYDKCKIGIAPEFDIWDSFRVLEDDGVDNFNIFLDKLDISRKTYRMLKGDLDIVFGSDITDQYDLHILDRKPVEQARELTIKRYGFWQGYGNAPFGIYLKYVKKAVDEYVKSGKRPAKDAFINYLDKELSPYNNGFDLGAPSKLYKNNEIWIGEAPIIMVRKDRHHHLLQDEGLL